MEIEVIPNRIASFFQLVKSKIDIAKGINMKFILVIEKIPIITALITNKLKLFFMIASFSNIIAVHKKIEETYRSLPTANISHRITLEKKRKVNLLKS